LIFPAGAELLAASFIELLLLAFCIVLRREYLKGSRFESFANDHKPITVPPQRFESVTAFVDEKKKLSIEHTALKDCFDHRAEAFKAFTHIDGPRAEIDLDVTRHPDHDERPAR
jgi:hypothetical protein